MGAICNSLQGKANMLLRCGLGYSICINLNVLETACGSTAMTCSRSGLDIHCSLLRRPRVAECRSLRCEAAVFVEGVRGKQESSCNMCLGCQGLPKVPDSSMPPAQVSPAELVLLH